MEIIYRRCQNEITVERLYGSEERVELPSHVDGLPVTAVERYAFSDAKPGAADEGKAICGEKLREIRLPRELRRIGGYAFYGCRNLEKLSLYHRIADIGGGAFACCHRLRTLQIHMEDAQGYCMKDMIGELRHELRVELLYGGEKAVLLFPEYFEEAVENTPARILETHVHGSGCHYRQCFRDGMLDYPGYDRQFAGAVAWESVDFCVELALLRLRFPYRLTEEAKGIYIAYLMERRMDAAAWCIELEQNEALEYISSFIDWRPEELTELIRQANESGRMEIQSFLLDYRHRTGRRQLRTFEL